MRSPPRQRLTATDGAPRPPGQAELSAATGVCLRLHRCIAPSPQWSEPKVIDRHGLVIVRSGGFRRRLDGRDAYVGPSMAYFEPRQAEHQTAHPHAAGDATSLFYFSDDAVARLAANAELPDVPIHPTGAIDLSHRRLVSAIFANEIDRFEADERVSYLVGALIEQAAPGRMTTRRPTTATAHRRLVDGAKEAIVADPAGSDLPTVAAAVGYSPFHVSRTFRQALGMTLTRFRNRVRTAIALDRLERGEADLAGLALELGFADQAHMTRVLREELGAPPGRVRRLLTGPAPISMDSARAMGAG